MNTTHYITVIPSECKVVVDGIANIIPSLKKDERLCNIHAIQWPGKALGHVELKEAEGAVLYYSIDDRDYQIMVAPYLALWEKQEVANKAIEDARIKFEASTEYKAQRLLSLRKRELLNTDYIVLPDYKADETLKEKALAYRKWLRDITELPGYPWDGGGKETPWPECYPWTGK